MYIYVAAGIIVTALAGYAAWLGIRLFRQQRSHSRKHQEAARDQAYSVGALARAVREDELNLSEAAIRIRVLLDHLLPAGEPESRYPAVHALYLATRELPRGPQRKRQPRQQTERQDAQRQLEESRHRERVRAELADLEKRYG